MVFVLTKSFIPFQEEGLPLLPRALSEQAWREATSSNAFGHMRRLRSSGLYRHLRNVWLPSAQRVVAPYPHGQLPFCIIMYYNLLYSLLPSHKVSVLLIQKFSLSGGNHRSSTSSGAQDLTGSSGNFRFLPALSPSSSKRRRPLSP